MANTTITIRTDKALKDDATKLFEGLGMNLSVAVNMFLRQAVVKQKYPLSLELDVSNRDAMGYPKGFFELFGSGADLDHDEEPDDPAPEDEGIEL